MSEELISTDEILTDDEDVEYIKREGEDEWRTDGRLSGEEANTALFEAWVTAKEYKRRLEEMRDELLEKLEQVEKRLAPAEKRIAAFGPESEIIDNWWGCDMLGDFGLDIEQMLTGYGKVWCAVRERGYDNPDDADLSRWRPVLLDEDGRVKRF
jgi:hypothetical protein